MEQPAPLSLRFATPADNAFQLALYASTRAEELALVDWSSEQKQAFVQMQFNAQNTHYAAYYPAAQTSIVQLEGQPIGRTIVDRSARHLLLMDIALLPEQRGRGIGTTLIRALIDEATQTGRGILLHVEFFNPAQRLYLRLGFRKIADQGVYWEMEWLPTSG